MTRTPEPAASTVKPSSLAAFEALGYALSARALLLLALIGAFVLAVMAMQYQTAGSLEVFVAFALGAVLPVTILEIRKGRIDGR